MSRCFAVETVTSAVLEIPPTAAVICAVPFVAAELEVKLMVATPPEETVDVVEESVPIPGAELPQLTVAPLGITVPPFVTESVSVVVALPLVSVWVGGLSVTVGATTVRVAVAYCTGMLFEGTFVTVIVVVPLAKAVIAPVEESTIATEGLLLPYETEPV